MVITVMHVIANVKFAQKAEAAGVDAVIAEGFEAGGHNGQGRNDNPCVWYRLVKSQVDISRGNCSRRN